MVDPPPIDDEPIQLVIGYYDDRCWPAAVPAILAFYHQFEPWEHEAIIAAEAVYASNFLCPN